eukprot:jgi/Picre1/28485/NNA_003889.t1
MKDPSCVGEVAAYEAVVEEEEQGIYCEGPRTIDGFQCSEGKVKAVSYLTLEQTTSEIRMGFMGEMPTVHSEKVQEALDEYFKGLDVQKDLMRKSQEVAKQGGAADEGEEMHKSASCPRIDDALERESHSGWTTNAATVISTIAKSFAFGFIHCRTSQDIEEDFQEFF